MQIMAEQEEFQETEQFLELQDYIIRETNRRKQKFKTNYNQKKREKFRQNLNFFMNKHYSKAALRK